MESERLIKLTNDEISRIKSCLIAERKNEEASKMEETNIEASDVMIRYFNNEADKRIEEIDSAYAKLSSYKPVFSKLEDLSKADLILKIKELEDKNDMLKDEIDDLKYDLDLFKNSESASTLAVASFFTSYENIQKRYDVNGVPYQMQTTEDISKVFGLRFNSIQGFNSLNEDEQEVFSYGVIKFLNNHGLGNRVPYLPVKVWKEGSEYRFLTLECGERHFFMNAKGEVY